MLWVYVGIIVVYFTIWYIVATIIKNAGIIDIGWGFGVVLIAWVVLLNHFTLVGAILATLISIWGLRLSYHIFKRNVGKPEDFRYAAFRQNWGRIYYVRSYFQVFMFQAVMMFLISLSYIYAIDNGIIDSVFLLVFGLAIWLAGFVFEAVGDVQLKRFISNSTNKGKLITTGLWSITRHPNYFGEAVLWWGIFFAALGMGAPWWTIVSPITITLLLRFVSGVPLLEARMKKKQGFAAYAKATSIFVPWLNKGE